MKTIVLRLAIIALLVYAGVSFWYDRVEKGLQEHPSVPAKQQEEAAPGQAAQPEGEEEATLASAGYAAIVTRNIFQAGMESAEYGGAFSHGDETGLEQTKLRLVLLGTVTGDSDDARAIIRDEHTKVEDLYRTGSEIQGARINRISRGQVILSVNGREEVLTIKDPGSGDQGGGAAELRVSARRAATAPPEMVPDEAIENKVPEAQPRRRISFRNAPPPAAEQPAPEENQSPPPDGESPPPEPGGEKPAETPPPGQ